MPFSASACTSYAILGLDQQKPFCYPSVALYEPFMRHAAFHTHLNQQTQAAPSNLGASAGGGGLRLSCSPQIGIYSYNI